jgi:hypothetical protein
VDYLTNQFKINIMTNVIKKNGVTFGIILAAYFVIRVALMYSIDLKLFTNGWFSLVDLIALLALTIIAIGKTKKAMGGFISFKEAFTVYFITILIGFVVYTIFNMLLFNVIDPGAKEVLQEEVIRKTVETMKSFGGDSAMLKETVTKMRETDSFSIPQQALGLGMALLMYSVVGLIVAAVMKKNRPFEYPTDESVNKIGDE